MDKPLPQRDLPFVPLNCDQSLKEQVEVNSWYFVARFPNEGGPTWPQVHCQCPVPEYQQTIPLFFLVGNNQRKLLSLSYQNLLF